MACGVDPGGLGGGAGGLAQQIRLVAPYGHVTKLLVDDDVLYTTIGTRAVGTWDVAMGRLAPVEPARRTVDVDAFCS